MTLFKNNPSSRVMIFIDYRNVHGSIKLIGDDIELDLVRLTHLLTGRRQLMGAYVFDARKRFTSKDDKVWMLHEKFRDQGFRVVARESFEIYKQEQKEVDVALASEMVVHALKDHYDVAIVVSGDRDFVPAIQHVQSAGKRVEVAAFDNAYNEECKKVADIYHHLDKMPLLAMRSPSYLDKEVVV